LSPKDGFDIDSFLAEGLPLAITGLGEADLLSLQAGGQTRH
jgi:hypothetical protein